MCPVNMARWRETPDNQGENVEKMIKGVQAVKGELSGLDKQLSNAFLRDVSLILWGLMQATIFCTASDDLLIARVKQAL